MAYLIKSVFVLGVRVGFFDWISGIGGEGSPSGMAPKPLDYESLNENVKKVAYAVRGELYLRASELQKEGKKVLFSSASPCLILRHQGFGCTLLIVLLLRIVFRKERMILVLSNALILNISSFRIDVSIEEFYCFRFLLFLWRILCKIKIYNEKKNQVAIYSQKVCCNLGLVFLESL